MLLHNRCVLACHLQEHNAPTKIRAKVLKLLLETYMYSAVLHTFVLLPNMPTQLPTQLCAAAKALQAVDQGESYTMMPICL